MGMGYENSEIKLNPGIANVANPTNQPENLRDQISKLRGRMSTIASMTTEIHARLFDNSVNNPEPPILKPDTFCVQSIIEDSEAILYDVFNKLNHIIEKL